MFSVRPHENGEPTFWNSSGLKGVLEKFRVCDGLVLRAGLTVQIKIVEQRINSEV